MFGAMCPDRVKSKTAYLDALNNGNSGPILCQLQVPSVESSERYVRE